MTDSEDLHAIIDRLDAAAAKAEDAAERLADEAEAVWLLAAEDRIQIARLILLVGRLTRQAGRLEAGAAVVAEDLAASTGRADDAGDVPGVAADAALRSAAPSEEDSAPCPSRPA